MPTIRSSLKLRPKPTVVVVIPLACHAMHCDSISDCTRKPAFTWPSDRSSTRDIALSDPPSSCSAPSSHPPCKLVDPPLVTWLMAVCTASCDSMGPIGISTSTRVSYTTMHRSSFGVRCLAMWLTHFMASSKGSPCMLPERSTTKASRFCVCCMARLDGLSGACTRNSKSTTPPWAGTALRSGEKTRVGLCIKGSLRY